MPKRKKDDAAIVIPVGAMVDTNVLIHAVNSTSSPPPVVTGGRSCDPTAYVAAFAAIS